MRKLIRKLCHRIFVVGLAIENERERANRLPGLSLASTNRNFFLGTNVTFGGEVLLLGGGRIVIGNDTMVGAGTIIHTSTHDYSLTPMNSKRIDKDVSIGKDVWIGTGAIICPGVHIEDGAVIGAGSVVVKDVASMTIVVGVPARQIKKRPQSK